MVNLLDPVPLAVIVLILTTVILIVVFASGGKKETPDNTSKVEKVPAVAVPAVEKKQTIVKDTPKAKESVEVNVLEDVPAVEKVVKEELKSVEINEEEIEHNELVAAAPEVEVAEPPLPEEQETAAFEKPVNEAEDAQVEEQEQSEAVVDGEAPLQTENSLENEQEDAEEPENNAQEVEGEDFEEEEEQYDEFNEEDADVAEYDESEYNPDLDYEQEGEEGEGRDSESQENTPHEHNTHLTLDTSSTGNSSPRSPTKRTPGGRNTNTNNEGGLSPMNSSAYKFGSHYQHKKVGDSWVKNSNTAASAAAASPVTVSPVRHSQPRKVIPVSDQEQPLSRKQSTKISQYEEGLQAEKTKVSNKVLETRRRTIEDVVHRVLLDGELPSEVDPATLIADPASAVVEAGAEVKTKQIVKEMKAKFGSPVVSNIGSNGRSVSSPESEPTLRTLNWKLSNMKLNNCEYAKQYTALWELWRKGLGPRPGMTKEDWVKEKIAWKKTIEKREKEKLDPINIEYAAVLDALYITYQLELANCKKLAEDADIETFFDYMENKSSFAIRERYQKARDAASVEWKRRKAEALEKEQHGAFAHSTDRAVTCGGNIVCIDHDCTVRKSM